MTGDVEHDLAAIRGYYADRQGCYPDKAGTIVFKDGAAAHPPLPVDEACGHAEPKRNA